MALNTENASPLLPEVGVSQASHDVELSRTASNILYEDPRGINLYMTADSRTATADLRAHGQVTNTPGSTMFKTFEDKWKYQGDFDTVEAAQEHMVAAFDAGFGKIVSINGAVETAPPVAPGERKKKEYADILDGFGAAIAVKIAGKEHLVVLDYGKIGTVVSGAHGKAAATKADAPTLQCRVIEAKPGDVAAFVSRDTIKDLKLRTIQTALTSNGATSPAAEVMNLTNEHKLSIVAFKVGEAGHQSAPESSKSRWFRSANRAGRQAVAATAKSSTRPAKPVVATATPMTQPKKAITKAAIVVMPKSPEQPGKVATTLRGSSEASVKGQSISTVPARRTGKARSPKDPTDPSRLSRLKNKIDKGLQNEAVGARLESMRQFVGKSVLRRTVQGMPNNQSSPNANQSKSPVRVAPIRRLNSNKKTEPKILTVDQARDEYAYHVAKKRSNQLASNKTGYEEAASNYEAALEKTLESTPEVFKTEKIRHLLVKEAELVEMAIVKARINRADGAFARRWNSWDSQDFFSKHKLYKALTLSSVGILAGSVVGLTTVVLAAPLATAAVVGGAGAVTAKVITRSVASSRMNKKASELRLAHVQSQKHLNEHIGKKEHGNVGHLEYLANLKPEELKFSALTSRVNLASEIQLKRNRTRLVGAMALGGASVIVTAGIVQLAQHAYENYSSPAFLSYGTPEAPVTPSAEPTPTSAPETSTRPAPTPPAVPAPVVPEVPVVPVPVEPEVIPTTFNVNAGDGFERVIADGYGLNGAQAHEAYEHIVNTVGTDILNGSVGSDEYINAATGEVGINNAGAAQFNREAQRAMNEFLASLEDDDELVVAR